MARRAGLVLAVLLAVGVSGTSGILTYFQTFPSRNENNEVVYEFRYSVDDPRSGVVKDRWEQRVGQFVKGSYSLLEPSGKVRTVSYEVDGHRGFVAVVRTSYPATSLRSTQQQHQAERLYPQPAVNLRRVYPPTHSQDPPINYHAAAAHSVTRPQPPQQGFQSGFQGGGPLQRTV